MNIYDIASVCRSKNAGPFQVTIDLMFNRQEDYQKLLNSKNFTAEKIGNLYGFSADKIEIKRFDRILTVKVVLPRKISSGAPGDSDVYGSQQHFPLGSLEI